MELTPSGIAGEPSTVHGPSVTTSQPGVRPGLQGFGGSLSECSPVFSGTSLVRLQGEAAADGPRIYLTLGFCISGRAM